MLRCYLKAIINCIDKKIKNSWLKLLTDSWKKSNLYDLYISYLFVNYLINTVKVWDLYIIIIKIFHDGVTPCSVILLPSFWFLPETTKNLSTVFAIISGASDRIYTVKSLIKLSLSKIYSSLIVIPSYWLVKYIFILYKNAFFLSSMS